MTENPKLLTVSEVAKIVGITRRILLHYEECGLIRPDKKMVRQETAIIQSIPLHRYEQSVSFKSSVFL